jgi:phosphoserine phosphatase
VAHCDLSFDPIGKLDGWYLTPCDYEGKSDYFHRLAQAEGLTPEQCAYIGDGVNDITLFAETGLSIAFNSHRPTVQAAAGVVVDEPDLRALLPHLP